MINKCIHKKVKGSGFTLFHVVWHIYTCVYSNYNTHTHTHDLQSIYTYILYPFCIAGCLKHINYASNSYIVILLVSGTTSFAFSQSIWAWVGKNSVGCSSAQVGVSGVQDIMILMIVVGLLVCSSDRFFPPFLVAVIIFAN